MTDATDYVSDNETVIAIDISGVSKAYSVAKLMWHEIVNDAVGVSRVGDVLPAVRYGHRFGPAD